MLMKRGGITLVKFRFVGAAVSIAQATLDWRGSMKLVARACHDCESGAAHRIVEHGANPEGEAG
jgi:hypothetical protein